MGEDKLHLPEATTAIVPAGAAAASSLTTFTSGGTAIGGSNWTPSGGHAYAWPNANVQYVTVSVHPNYCQCGGTLVKETIGITGRKVKAGGDGRRKFTAIGDTREALVCEHCGIVAWFGHGEPPTAV